MIGALWRLEARRTIGLPFLPAMVAISWLLTVMGDHFTTRALFYVETNVAVLDLTLLTAPLLTGAAAWLAGREGRRGVEDLLATTSRPSWQRHLVAWMGTLVWGVVAYLATFGYVAVATLRYALWTSPVLWSILLGLLILSAASALGYTLGRAVPSRFTAPLIALVSFLALFVIWIAVTSPVSYADRATWFGRPSVEFFPALALLGLTGLGMGSVGILERRGLVSQSALAVAGVLTVAGIGGMLLKGAGAPPDPQVCIQDPLPVCVQRAYRPWLGDDATVVNQIAAPLLGLPDAPVRAEQQPAVERGMAGTVLIFQPQDETNRNHFAGVIAGSLVRDSPAIGSIRPMCPSDPTAVSCSAAQNAIALWLVRRTGQWTDFSGVNGHWLGLVRLAPWDATSAAAQRFAALPSAQQREWLSSHYLTLRQGRVHLEELP